MLASQVLFILLFTCYQHGAVFPAHNFHSLRRARLSMGNGFHHFQKNGTSEESFH